MSWVGYFFLLTIQDSSWFSIASLIYSKLHDFLREQGQKPKIRKKWTFPVVVFFLGGSSVCANQIVLL